MRIALALSILSVCIAGGVHAQCQPDPANSFCTLNVIRNDACPAGGTSVVWCPGGDMSVFEVRVHLVDISGTPCSNSPVRIIVRLSGNPTVAANNLWGCGFDVVGQQIFPLVTDAFGDASAQFWGGGCGCLNIDYTVDAAGTIVCVGQGVYCVKSPDMTGDGAVQFLDVFQYLPCLQAGAFSSCCDLNCDGSITFQDTFQFLPHLSGGHTCVGNMLPIAPSPVPPICF